MELWIHHTDHFSHVQRLVNKGLDLLCLVEGLLEGPLIIDKDNFTVGLLLNPALGLIQMFLKQTHHLLVITRLGRLTPANQHFILRGNQTEQTRQQLIDQTNQRTHYEM